MVDGRTDFALLGGRRPSFRDIAILVNNRTKLELYIDQLEAAGIPYHHDSGRGFFTSPGDPRPHLDPYGAR